MTDLPPRAGAESSAGPLASVITVNTNELHRLRQWLPSVSATRADFEIIVSDNGSGDGSLEFLAERYPAVRVVANGSNIGFCAANNRAADSARGRFLVFLNPDTTVDPDWLTRLIEPFRDPDVGLTTSKILLMKDPDRINTCGNAIHLTGLTLCRGMGKPKETFAAAEDAAAVSGAAFAIRRELFRALGGFDEDYFIYMDETDLSCRAWLAGWRCRTAPQSLVWHDYAMRFGSEKVLRQERNRYQTILKNFRWPTIAALLPGLLLAEAITWAFVLLIEPAHARKKWQAYAEVARRWREIMRKRRTVQALRIRRDRDLVLRMTWNLDFLQVTSHPLSRLAAVVFNPLFLLLWCYAALLVWW